MKDTFLDICEVFGVNLMALYISFETTYFVLKMVSLVLAISYTGWKFYTDYKKHKKEK